MYQLNLSIIFIGHDIEGTNLLCLTIHSLTHTHTHTHTHTDRQPDEQTDRHSSRIMRSLKQTHLRTVSFIVSAGN